MNTEYDPAASVDCPPVVSAISGCKHLSLNTIFHILCSMNIILMYYALSSVHSMLISYKGIMLYINGLYWFIYYISYVQFSIKLYVNVAFIIYKI